MDHQVILRNGAQVAVPVLLGEIKQYAGFALPTGYAWCNGGEISIYDHPDYFFAVGGAFGEGAGALAFTLAVTNGSTLVTSSANHGFSVGDPVGSVIAAVSNITDPATLGLQFKYQIPMYVSEVVSATTFRVAEYGVGTNLSFTVTNSGYSVFTHVKTPDLRGRVVVGRDNMGGSAANRLESLTNDGEHLGETGGADTHTLTTAQIPAHEHVVSATVVGNTTATGGQNRLATLNTGSSGGNQALSTSSGGGGSHNNLQPLLICNHIIRVA